MELIIYLGHVPMKDFSFKCEMSSCALTFYKKGFPASCHMGGN